MTVTGAYRNQQVVSADRKATHPARLSAVAWMPTRDLDYPEWAAAGRQLGAMGRCGQWGMGDWIQYGNAQFGERYAKAARVSGYDVQTLMNMVYVASRYEISRRREDLSWSHHETLAAYQCDEQDYWLDRAAAERLSVADLRSELRASRKRRERTAGEGLAPVSLDAHGSLAGEVDAAGFLCPHCGKAVPSYRERRVPAMSKGVK